MAKKKLKEKQHFFNNPFDFTLCITVFLMLALGIVMVLSASSPSSLARSGSSYEYLRTQVISAILGIIAMLIFSKIDYRFYKKFYKIGYVISIILLLSVLVIGYESGGAKRWINLGFTTFQPSEVVKLLMIVFYATILSEKKEKLQEFMGGFVYNMAFLGPIIGIILIFQKHFSASLLIIVVTVVMMVVAGCKISHFITVGTTVGIPGILALLFLGEGFRLNRVITFLNPWADIQGSGWQVIQGLYAIGSGGLFGVGLRSK